MTADKTDKVEVFSQRIASDIHEQIRDLFEKGEFKTWSDFFAILLERYSNPLRINSENVKEIESLKAEIIAFNLQKQVIDELIESKNKEISELRSELQESNNYHQTLQSNISMNGDLLDKAQRELSSRLTIDPLNMKILKHVAEREGKKRNQEWTPSDVVNCFIEFRFVRGTVNGGFDSVPDEIVKKLKSEE